MTPLEKIVNEIQRRPQAPVSAHVIGIFAAAIAVLLMLGWTSGTLKP